ncbi:multiubiquitin domain-containing protein [Roseivirga seohaensis]|uniref:multiubiquitin domain-containing protein n=1 Tax=Roseivirga seohaensis TaxID=1914963 RepID=UPI003BACDF47
MKVKLTWEGDLSSVFIEVDGDTRVGDVIRKHLPQFANASDYNEDLEAYLENGKDELSKDARISEIGLREGDALHFSRCSKIDVTVCFEDKETILNDLRPSLILKRVEKMAIKELGINVSAKKLQMEIKGVGKKLDEQLHLGSLTTYPNCKVMLNLVPEDEKITEIVVNGRAKPFDEKKISFEKVIVLAFGEISNNPNVFYTVTYKRGMGDKPEGSLVRGQEVRVKNKMIFNATCTDKS